MTKQFHRLIQQLEQSSLQNSTRVCCSNYPQFLNTFSRCWGRVISSTATLSRQRRDVERMCHRFHIIRLRACNWTLAQELTLANCSKFCWIINNACLVSGCLNTTAEICALRIGDLNARECLVANKYQLYELSFLMCKIINELPLLNYAAKRYLIKFTNPIEFTVTLKGNLARKGIHDWLSSRAVWLLLVGSKHKCFGRLYEKIGIAVFKVIEVKK